MTSEDRLREYVEKDDIYQNFINGILKANDMSDFDKFCVQHCKDIEKLLGQKNEWIELLGKFKTQQKDFIMWLHSYIEKLTTTGCYNNDDDEILILKIVLKRYEEIVNGTEQNEDDK